MVICSLELGKQLRAERTRADQQGTHAGYVGGWVQKERHLRMLGCHPLHHPEGALAPRVEVVNHDVYLIQTVAAAKIGDLETDHTRAVEPDNVLHSLPDPGFDAAPQGQCRADIGC